MDINSPRLADDTTITDAARLLRQGRLVAFPTETVYGLGADASNPEAVRRIFAAKGRPADHPLIVHIQSADMLVDWAETIPDTAYLLAKHFWPGPLAIILKKKSSVPLEVTGGQSTIALRVPNHPVALQLLQKFGGGIAAPSANRYCRISPTTAAHVLDELGTSVDLILDGGSCAVGVESSIIDLSGDKPKLLRPGHISRSELAAVLQTEVLVPEIRNTEKWLDANETRAPGMLELHYAPETRALRCPSVELAERVKELHGLDKKIGLLVFEADILETPQTRVIKLPSYAYAYAQGLYAALRELDAHKLDLLLVEQPPENETWQAVNDRLKKATVAR